jgi:anoctamin-10
MKINKQLELGYADLFSLEPCDDSFRPLRLKNYIRDYLNDQELKNRLEKMVEYEEETKKEKD